MTRLISTTLLLMSLAATCFAQQHHEVHEDNVDIDERQYVANTRRCTKTP